VVQTAKNFLTGYESTEDGTFEYHVSAVQAIAHAVAVNTTLRHLDVSDNTLFNVTRHSGVMSPAAIDELRHGIAENARNGGALTSLNLVGNMMRLEARVDDVTGRPAADATTDRARLRAVELLVETIAQHPHLGQAHASCYFGVHPASDPIGDRGVAAPLRRPPLPLDLLAMPSRGMSMCHPRHRYDHASGADVILANHVRSPPPRPHHS